MRIAILVLVLISGCSSVPLGTMLKLAGFDVEDVVKTNPAEVRAAIITDERVTPSTATVLKLAVVSEGNEQLYEYQLKALPLRSPAAVGLEPAGPGRHWLLYALAEQDLERFTDMQRDVYLADQAEQIESIRFSVGSGLGDLPDDIRRDGIPFGVELQLSQDDGYFTLIRETVVEVEVEEG